MKTALEISDTGDAAILLLNPQVITTDGEWEAWFFSNWNPGARRYPSFWELMHRQYETMTNLTTDNNKRRFAKVNLTQLSAKLPGLVTELRSKAATWPSFVIGFGSELNDGQAQALNEIADEVQALIDVPRTPAETLAVLLTIVESAEYERSFEQGSVQTQIRLALVRSTIHKALQS